MTKTCYYLMLLLFNKLNEVLNLLCMRNGKLIGPTHCDATTADSMPVRLTEMESNTIGLIIYRY